MVAISEQSQKFSVEKMTVDDVQPANELRLESWIDTYVNDELGITRRWIEVHNQDQNTVESNERRKIRLTHPNHAAWVAKDSSLKIIGLTTPFMDDEGVQHVGSLYVDKNWLGKGVGSALMQKVIDWSNTTKPIELHVVAYNERAIAFYQKWGFEMQAHYYELFDDKIPEIMMIRKGDKQ